MTKRNRFFRFRDPNDERPKKLKNEEVVDMERLEQERQTAINFVVALLQAIQIEELQRKTVLDSIISLLQTHQKEYQQTHRAIEALDDLLNQTPSKKAIDSLIDGLDSATIEEIWEFLISRWDDYQDRMEGETRKAINSITSLLQAHVNNVSKTKKSIESLIHLFEKFGETYSSSSDYGYSSAEEYLEDSLEEEYPADSWEDDDNDDLEEEYPADLWEDDDNDDLEEEP